MYKLDEKIIRDIKRGGCFKEVFIFAAVIIGSVFLASLILWLFGWN